MSNGTMKCPHCGESITIESKTELKTSRHIITGGLTGLGIGAVFDYFYFYIGVITDFFSFMPVVHLVAGVSLGALVGWIIGQKKAISAKQGRL